MNFISYFWRYTILFSIKFLYYYCFQLERITDLLGTPSIDDMKYACEGAVAHMLRRSHKPPALHALYTLGSHATHDAVHLLTKMLIFDPVSYDY